jgi:hypothetical protein
VDITRAWKAIRENISTSTKVSLELRQYTLWLDEGGSELLDQRKRAKLQWLQDLSQIHLENLNSVRYEASKHFKNKTKDYRKDKINGLTTHSQNKNIRDLHTGIN